MKPKPRILVVDIGGSHVKLTLTGRRQPVKFESGPKMTPAQMFKQLHALTHDWEFDAVSIGYPGPVVDNKPAVEPHNLGKGWVRFDFHSHFKKPVRIINDAALQALGSYKSGRMLFIGLGTGLGSALIVDDVVVPLELCQLRYSKTETLEDHLGKAGLKKCGKKKWEQAVHEVVAQLRAAFLADDVVIGGGNAKKLEHTPEGSRLGSNQNSFLGGVRLWAALPASARPQKTRWEIG